MAVNLGTTELRYGLLLGPMAGFTDHAFRKVCLSHGAEYVFSEMLSAKALCFEQRSRKERSSSTVRTGSLARVRPDDLPIGIQLFGSDPVFFAEASKRIESGDYRGCVSTARPTSIDINMGCPMPKITGNGEGSALLRDPDLCARIVDAVKRAVDIPVSAKIRIGYDDRSLNAVEVAKRLEQAGADFITVHGRTRTDLYRPGVRRDVIREVKNAVSVPVIANGDVWTAEGALRMLEETRADGLMIARGALGNPWLFEEIRCRMDGRTFVPPTPEKRIAQALDQVRIMTEDAGEDLAVPEARKHLAYYTKGMRGSAQTRAALMTVATLSSIRDILNRLLEENGG